MKKKSFALFLAILMALNIAACNKKTNSQSSNPSVTNVPGDSTAHPGSPLPSGGPSDNPTADPSSDPSKPTPLPGHETTYDGRHGSASGSFELTDVTITPADGIGKPGVDFPVPSTGSVAGWSDEEKASMPGFNPLGDRTLYSEYYFNTDTFTTSDMKYLADDSFTPCSMSVVGYEHVLTSEDTTITKNWILYKAKELNAAIYKTTDDTAFFVYTDESGYTWFIYAELSDYQVRIYEYSVKTLSKDGTISLTADFEGGVPEEYVFCTKSVPGRQQSLSLSFDSFVDDIYDGIRLTGYASFRIGEYEFHCDNDFESYSNVIGPRTAERVVFDNIAAEPEWIFWIVNYDSYSGNYNVSAALSETGELQKITLGEQPGLVKIVGAGSDFGARLIPYFYLRTSDLYADSLEGGFLDDKGNYCFVAPAGYYSLEVGSSALEDFEFYVQNVPVSSGKITEILIPSETKAYAADLLEIGRSSEVDVGNMEVQYIIDNGDTATVCLLVHDPEERDLFPDMNDFTVTENGEKCEITGIEHLPQGTNVIMCIDSSGSIRKSLPDIIKSACKFVENLPENCTISIIEFKQELIEHPGTTKAEAIKALNSISASGDTSLYDSISLALDRLENVSGAYIIAFTDGVDSREPGDPAPGSSISKEELCEKIGNSNATVLGMGFGSGHDAATLKMISESSVGGQYYSVADVSALDGAFSQVQSKLGNQFKITYKRPIVKEDSSSDVPVVSIMMDVSRSMNLLPEELEDTDVEIRLEKVRALFHDFILNLPDKSIAQFASFSTWLMGGDLIKTRQILSQNKTDLLKALSLESTVGGTPIQKALDMAFDSLKNVSSSKKVLVFFTDAALEVTDDGSGAQKQAFEETLYRMKQSGIRILFAGLGGEEYASSYDEVFRYAAEKAGGDYIISNSVEEIEAKLNELLSKINQPVQNEKGVNIYASLSCKAEDGSMLNYSAGYTAPDMTLKKQKGEIREPGMISVKFAGDYITYSGDTSALLYGTDTAEETKIDSRISFTDAAGSNKFADLSVSEAFIMPMFKGIDAGSKRFLALNVTLTFHKKDASLSEVGYMIPNIFNHFYVCLNNGRMMPASQATWLAETPFAVPGECSVQVNELKDEKGNKKEIGESISGILVFVVENANDWNQLSLHYYDTSYGHIEIPIVGSLPQGLMNISELPMSEPKDISESFRLSLTGCEDTRELKGTQFVTTAYYDSDKSYFESFRILEMQFESKVQALLDINPIDRFYYRIPTNSGDLLTKMSDAVYNLPLGFTGGTKFAPGSATSVRLPFVLPSALLNSRATLWGELANGSFELPVKNGNIWNGYNDNKRYEHEYFTLVVNKFAYLDELKDTAVLDFTIIDKEDGEGIGGFDTMLYLFRNTEAYADVNDISGTSSGSTIIDAVSRKGLGNFSDMTSLMEPAGIKMADLYATGLYVFGAHLNDSDWGAYDGQSRRGILIFDIPSDDHKSDWKLCAECLPELSLPISDTLFGDSPLLVKKAVCEIDTSLNDAIERKVDVAVASYRATHPASGTTEKVGLSDDEIVGNHVVAPYYTVYGTQKMEAVKNIDDFLKLMESIALNPSGNYVYNSPEAVLTQGYGNDAELYNLAKQLLMQLGYKTTVKKASLTDKGKENLARFCGVTPDSLEYDEVYAIGYTDENGTARVYVPSFRHYADELSGLIRLLYEKPSEPGNLKGRITVRAFGELTGNAGMAAQNLLMTQFADIFGGGDGETSLYEEVCLLDEEFDFTSIGRNPIDVSFISLGKDADGINDKVTAAADTVDGLIKNGERWVSTADYKFDRIEVEINGSSFDYSTVHTFMLDEGDSLLDVFMSLGVNLPGIHSEAAKAYEKAVSDSVKAFENSEKTNYGICRWTTHAALAKTARTLTEIDNEACEKLGVMSVISTTRPSVICATLKSDGTNSVGSLDLASFIKEIVLTKETQEKGTDYYEVLKAYNLAVSMEASSAEGDAFPNGSSYLDVWASLPSDAVIVNVDCNMDERMKAVEEFRKVNAPAYLLERLEKADYQIAFVIPTAPGKINGRDRWAWLEIDTYTMATISVFDTGERGMASYIIGLTPKGMLEFGIGAFTGLACSGFAVSAYSLESDDYEYVMKSARALMGYTFECIKFFQGTVSDIQSVYQNPVQFLENKGGEAVQKATDIDIMKWYYAYRDNDPQRAGTEPSFTDGFEAAMKMYFGE